MSARLAERFGNWLAALDEAPCVICSRRWIPRWLWVLHRRRVTR
jgi:hypothetical protein